MSVAIRGTPTSVTGTGTTNSVAKPTGVVSGDFLILTVGIDSVTTAITPPTGFSLLGTGIDFSDNSWRTRTYWKLAGGSEPSTYSFSFGGSVFHDVDLTAYSGADTAQTPHFTENTGNGTTATGLGITFSQNGSMLYHHAVSGVGARTSGPSGFTSELNYDTNLYVDDLAVNSGASGNKTSVYPTQIWAIQMVGLESAGAFTPNPWTGQEEKPAPPPRLSTAKQQLVTATAWVLTPIVAVLASTIPSADPPRPPTRTTSAVQQLITATPWTGSPILQFKMLHQQQAPSYPPQRPTTAVEQLVNAPAWTGSPIIQFKLLHQQQVPAEPPVTPPIRPLPPGWHLSPLTVTLLTFFDQQTQRPPPTGRTLYAESGGDNSAGVASGSIGFLAQDPPERPPAPAPRPRHEVPWTQQPLALTLLPFLDTPGAPPRPVPPIERGQEQAQPLGTAVLYRFLDTPGRSPPVVPQIERGPEQAQPLGRAILYPFVDTPGRAPPVIPPIARGDQQAQPLGAAVLYPFLDSPGMRPPTVPVIERGPEQAQPFASAVLYPFLDSPGQLPRPVPQIKRGDEQARNLGKPFVATSTGWEPQGARPPVVPAIPRLEQAKPPGQLVALTVAASTGWEPQGQRAPVPHRAPRLELTPPPGAPILRASTGWEPGGARPRAPAAIPRVEQAEPPGSPIATLAPTGWEPSGQQPPRAARIPAASSFTPAGPTISAPLVAAESARPRAPQRRPAIGEPWQLAPIAASLLPFIGDQPAMPPRPPSYPRVVELATAAISPERVSPLVVRIDMALPPAGARTEAIKVHSLATSMAGLRSRTRSENG